MHGLLVLLTLDKQDPRATSRHDSVFLCWQVIYYLSGLTCDDTNVTTKGCPQRAAAEHGVAFIAPDTSPRGLGIEGEDESWDFGTGAGFYLNATQDKWKQYRMYDYILKELPAVLGNLQNLDLDKASTSTLAPAIRQSSMHDLYPQHPCLDL